MTLADLIDLEARLALDAREDDDVLHQRDRAVAKSISPDGDRRARILAWVDALRPRDRASVGSRVAAALALLRSALFAVGLLVGGGAASVALFYDGTRPVNVASFVFALVVPQVVLLALTLIVLFAMRLRGDARTRSIGAPITRRLLRYVSSRMASSREAITELESVWGRLDARRGLRPDVERHTLFGVLQVFGVAFNLGAIGTVLVRIAFTDVSFGWSSTLIAWDTTMSRIVHVLSLPWAHVWPDASPSGPLVHATRFYHGGAVPDPELAGRWWPFLVASLLVYGLIPRSVLLLVASVSARRALSGVPLDTPDVDAALRRLTAPSIAFAQHAPLGPLALGTPTSPAEDASGSRLYVPISWRCFPIESPSVSRAITRTFGGTIGEPMSLGGPDHAATDRTLTTLPTILREGDAVLVMCETVEPPDAGLRRMLARLRGLIGARRPILVALAHRVAPDGRVEAASQETLSTWRRKLDVLADPYLRVEALDVEASR